MSSCSHRDIYHLGLLCINAPFQHSGYTPTSMTHVSPEHTVFFVCLGFNGINISLYRCTGLDCGACPPLPLRAQNDDANCDHERADRRAAAKGVQLLL